MKKSRIRVLYSVAAGSDYRKLKQALKSEGIDYRQVQGVNKLRRYIRYWQPDLILLDYDLYRDEVDTRLTPWLDDEHAFLAFLVKRKDEEYMAELLQDRLDAYFFKPLHKTLFRSKLRALLRLKSKQRQPVSAGFMKSLLSFLP